MVNEVKQTTDQLLDELARAQARIAELELDRRRVEQTLHQLRDNMSRYLDLAEVVLVALDHEGKVTLVGGRCFQILGYNPDELIGQDWFEICLPPDEYERVHAVNRQLMAGNVEPVEYFENKIRRKDGTERLVAWHNSSLTDGSGRILGILSTGVDITERKRIENALTEERRMYASLVKNLPGMVYRCRNDKDWTIEYVSEGCQALTGYRPADFLTKRIAFGTDVIHPDDQAGVWMIVQEDVRNKRAYQLTYRIVTADKSIKWVWEQGSGVFSDQGEFIALEGFVSDVTLQKHQEEQIRRSQKMDALGKLTGGIAHDYNNMLGVILGYSKLLQDALADDPKLSTFINEIHRASERGTRLSRKLMAFSRQKQPELGVCDVNAVLSSMQDLLQKTLTPRIDLVYDLAPDAWPVAADSGDLEDSIVNLCINALHAMDSGGTLTLRTRNERHEQADDAGAMLPLGDYVVLTVHDTGCGMDSATLNRIFDPFFTTKGADGLGLGLSMVYGFMQRSGGEIKVTSALGKGSVFRLYFPRYAAAQPATTPADGVDSKRFAGNETILVVDDEPALLDLAEEILSAHGYRVLTAASGEEALKILGSQPVDLLLSDVIMPRMDGYQLAAIVEGSFPEVKIQLVSGYADGRDPQGRDSPLSLSLLPKPFTAQTLLQRVRERLDQESIAAMSRKRRVMIMDDDESVRELFRINLEKLGYEAVSVSDGNQAIACYKQAIADERPIDVCILDIAIPGKMDGKATARELLALDPRARLVVSSGDSFGAVMTGFKEFGFRGAIEKTFDRAEIERVLDQVLHG